MLSFFVYAFIFVILPILVLVALDFREQVYAVFCPTETQKAAKERRAELDRRTAQIIRERGISVDRANAAAITEYEQEMKETGV